MDDCQEQSSRVVVAQCREPGLEAEGSWFKLQHRPDLTGVLVVGPVTLLSTLGYCRSVGSTISDLDLLSCHNTPPRCHKKDPSVGSQGGKDPHWGGGQQHPPGAQTKDTQQV